MNAFKQSLISLLAIGVAGLLLYNMYESFTQTPQFQQQGTEIREKYDRWVRESRLADAASRAILEERMRQFDPTVDKLHTRSTVIESLESYAGTFDFYMAAVRPIEEDGTTIDMEPSIEEADTRSDLTLTSYRYTPVENVGLGGRNTRLRAQQERRLSELESRVILQSELLRGILHETSISIGPLLDRAATVSADDLVSEEFLVYLRRSGLEQNFIDHTAQVMARITEARKLQDVLRSAPLASPVLVNHRLTSGFGMRIDPFTRRPRQHNGLDVVAFRRAPVVASSPGRVVYAGWKSGYGNCVYIDHGYGFQTRYAHLDSTLVRIGQEVQASEPVGLMGSTGRSTGTHLHWEIWYRGRPVDPLRFLQAGATIYGS